MTKSLMTFFDLSYFPLIKLSCPDFSLPIFKTLTHYRSSLSFVAFIALSSVCVIVRFLKLSFPVFRTLVCRLKRYWIGTWYMNMPWRNTEQVRLSPLKSCIHLRRSLLLNFNFLVSVTASGPRSPRGHM